MTCNFPKVFQYTFSCLVLWNRANKQAIVCYRYANTQVLSRADFVVITLKEWTFVLNLKTVIAITIKINVFFAVNQTQLSHCGNYIFQFSRIVVSHNILRNYLQASLPFGHHPYCST